MAKHTAVPPTSKATKSAWKARSDAGPHTATLPSGIEVRFTIPDSNALITARKLPEDLTEIALYAASYPDGASGYMSDMSVRAAMSDHPDAPEKLAKAVADGIRLGHWLVAHMLVDPTIDADDVPDLPPMDVRMLLEFAERRRDTDALGVRLPIALLEEYERFLHQPGGAPPDGDGGGVDPDVPAAEPGADEG